MVKFEATLRHFSAVADAYDSRSLSFPWSWIRQAEWRAVSAIAGPVQNLNMLDLGCGAGHFSRNFRQCGVSHIHAVDVSANMVATLKDEEKIVTTVSPVENLALAERFDLIVAAGLLEFMETPEVLFSIAAKHARQGAKLVMLYPRIGLLGHIYRLYHRRNGLEINFLSDSVIANMAEIHGWHRLKNRSAGPIATAAVFQHQNGSTLNDQS